MKNVTIADVAKAAGVSVTTVSRYLNGNYKKMSAQTKKHLEVTIADLHYTPKTSARRMRQQQSFMVGVIVADISNVFSSRLFQGIYDVLQPAGYDVTLMNSSNKLTTETDAIDRLFAQQVDGVILQPNSRRFQPYQRLRDHGLPLVLVDRQVAEQPQEVMAVQSSNFDATYRLGAHLQQLGYSRVFSFSRTLAEISAQTDRIKGLTAFGSQHQMTYQNIETAGLSATTLRTTVQAMLARSPEHTAIVSLMGPLLFDLLQVFREEGLTFPKDLGLVSFDDWSWSQYVNDGIYLLQQQPDLMGRLAAQQLLHQMTHHTLNGGIQYVPVETISKPSI